MFLVVVMLLVAANSVTGQDLSKVAPKIQATAVTICVGKSCGSGVLITRELVGPDGKLRKYNFVLTCGHVVSGLKKTRTEHSNQFGQITYTTWEEAKISQQVVKDGKPVCVINLTAKVVFYSACEEDDPDGQDLALLLVQGDKIIDINTTFNVKDIMGVGVGLIHCGTPKGQHQSVTTGIVSFVGRGVKFPSGATSIFDQICVSALPGSSGGGIWTQDGKYVGMLVRQTDENFNLMIPTRRIKVWADALNAAWIYDVGATLPPLSTIPLMK
jgi:hypothetical protein